MSFFETITFGKKFGLFFKVVDHNSVSIKEQVKTSQVENFMRSTTGETSMARTNSGLLFTSWSAQDQSGPSARSDFLHSSISNDQEFKLIKRTSMEDQVDHVLNKDLVDQVHNEIVQNGEVKKGWNRGQVPTFPHYHGLDTTRMKASLDENLNGDNILDKKTSQLSQLIDSFRKNYRQDQMDNDHKLSHVNM
jgi:hypothetical protein